MKTEMISIADISQHKKLNLGDSEFFCDRNLKIIQMLADDKRPVEIAKDLLMSVATVRWCIEWMRNNNNVHTCAALVALAFRAHAI